jgi:hypothetical protein
VVTLILRFAGGAGAEKFMSPNEQNPGAAGVSERRDKRTWITFIAPPL